MSIFAAVAPNVEDAMMGVIFFIVWCAYAGFILVLSLGSTVLAVVALVSIYRNRVAMSGIEVAAWVAISLFAQIAGPICWFAIGRRKVREEASAQTNRKLQAASA